MKTRSEEVAGEIEVLGKGGGAIEVGGEVVVSVIGVDSFRSLIISLRLGREDRLVLSGAPPDPPVNRPSPSNEWNEAFLSPRGPNSDGLLPSYPPPGPPSMENLWDNSPPPPTFDVLNR